MFVWTDKATKAVSLTINATMFSYNKYLMSTCNEQIIYSHFLEKISSTKMKRILRKVSMNRSVTFSQKISENVFMEMAQL